MLASPILNTHLDITLTLDSDMTTKDTFISCSLWNIDFTNDGTNIKYQGGVTKYCYCRYNIQV